MDEMLSHCKAAARGARRAFLVGDMPFGSGAALWWLAVSLAVSFVSGQQEPFPRTGSPQPAPTHPPAGPAAARRSGGERVAGGAERDSHDEGGADGCRQDRGRLQVGIGALLLLAAGAAVRGGWMMRSTAASGALLRSSAALLLCMGSSHSQLPRPRPALLPSSSLALSHPLLSHPPPLPQQPRQGGASGGRGGRGGDGPRGPHPAGHLSAGRLPARRAVGCGMAAASCSAAAAMLLQPPAFPAAGAACVCCCFQPSPRLPHPLPSSSPLPSQPARRCA